MSDSVVLEVNGKRIDTFESYTVDADLYVADHAFSLEVRNPQTVIKAGMPCKLYVNNKLELTGIIDRTVKRTDRQGWRMTIEGRDLMGLLVDSYCEDFISVAGMKLSALAQLLLKNVPGINRKQILYQQDLVGKLKTRRSRESSYGLQALFGEGESAERIAQIRPGMTVFQVLSMYALSRGQMFFGLPDGTFVFGRPRVGGQPDFQVTFTRAGSSNNAMASEVVEDYSKRYSKVTVVGQRQAHPDDGLDISATFVGGAPGTVSDPTFPFYKPYVQLSHNDSQTPKQHARLILTKMRHDGLQLSYDLPRHSQNGANFGLNRLCQVQDNVNLVDGKPINGIFLISGRTFRMDKQNGPMTTLRLSPPGLIEDGGKAGGGRG